MPTPKLGTSSLSEQEKTPPKDAVEGHAGRQSKQRNEAKPTGLVSSLQRSGQAAVMPVGQALKDAGVTALQTWRVARAIKPLLALLGNDKDVNAKQLRSAIDLLFKQLYAHPLTHQTEKVTGYLRKYRLIPNEQSTEDLIRFVVDQMVQRSPVPIPDALINEFWAFFDELFSSPELKGLGELSLDMVRLVVHTYEPLLVEIVNLLKAGRRFNQWQLKELLRRAAVVRNDLEIVRRQIKALRYIRPFFQADPKDFASQAQIVAAMVGEFGPFFVKMAQVAAANAGVLPEEIAKELAVFHEDVPPMSADEVIAAFDECYGTRPENLYMDFDASNPIKSGSIGSVYVAKKPFVIDGEEVLIPVVIKVGRHNIDREFVIGKMVIGLAIMSSQYWAPHSKLTPFLRALGEQVEEFVEGFQKELDFYEEARIQMRFYERSSQSRRWHVPAIYGATRRILEMEYLQDTTSLMHALENHPPKVARRLQKRLTQNLLYSVLQHIFLYQEVHGDLHPGNVLINPQGELYLIDWGNCVTMDGKWGAVWNYLVGAVLADMDVLTDALIAISTAPEANLKRRDEIRTALQDTLQKKGVVPITRKNFVRELSQGGFEGLHRRGQTVMHLASNTQQLGLVVRSDYLHLSRSLFAAVGSFSGLYADTPKLTMLLDMLGGLTGFPWRLAKDRVDVEIDRVRGSIGKAVPILQSARMERRARLSALSVDFALPAPVSPRPSPALPAASRKLP